MTNPYRHREPQEQVANAHDDFVDLTPVSQEYAEQVRNEWAALLTDDGRPRRR